MKAETMVELWDETRVGSTVAQMVATMVESSAACLDEMMVAMMVDVMVDKMVDVMVDSWVWWKVAVKAAKTVGWTESRRDGSKAAWMGVTMVWTRADGMAS